MPKLIAPLAAGLAVAVITAGYLWQQLRAERELAASWQQQVTGLQEQVAQLEQRLQRPAASDQRSVPQPQVAVASPPQDTAVTMPAPAAAVGVRMADSAARTRALLTVVYPDIDKVLDLTAEETEALAQLLGSTSSEAAIEAVKVDSSWRHRTILVSGVLKGGALPQSLAGFRGTVLGKPFDVEELRNAIRHCLMYARLSTGIALGKR